MGLSPESYIELYFAMPLQNYKRECKKQRADANSSARCSYFVHSIASSMMETM